MLFFAYYFASLTERFGLKSNLPLELIEMLIMHNVIIKQTK